MLRQGDVVEFLVGPDGDSYGDLVSLSATISATPETLDPVIAGVPGQVIDPAFQTQVFDPAAQFSTTNNPTGWRKSCMLAQPITFPTPALA